MRLDAFLLVHFFYLSSRAGFMDRGAGFLFFLPLFSFFFFFAFDDIPNLSTALVYFGICHDHNEMK